MRNNAAGIPLNITNFIPKNQLKQQIVGLPESSLQEGHIQKNNGNP
jgi:nitrogen fixation protein